MKKKWMFLALVGGLLAFFILGLDTRLVVRRYSIESKKLNEVVRIVFLSDLHSCEYGKGQGRLLELVAEQQPDMILLGGDWVDDDFGHQPPERAYEAARAMAEMCPTYYVSGNHEVWSGYGETLKTAVAGCGVTVLTGSGVRFGNEIQVFGIDDPAIGEENWNTQMDKGRELLEEGLFTVLLTHRPERAEEYNGFDLILAGHAHGGQWRLPGVINGLFAPNQGWLPMYAGGKYELEESVMIVGRGLSQKNTRVPRFYNRPEVVVVELVPAK